MDPVLLVILSVVEILAIITVITNYRLYRKIVDTPTEEIGHLNRGYKEIKGKVVALEKLLESPLSNVPCVYYEFIVRKKQGKRYKTIITDKGVSKFGIDDGTGIAGIDIKQAILDLKDDAHSRSGSFNPADDTQVAALEKYEIKSKGRIFEKNLTYNEKFIREGDELYVIGDAESLGNDAILMKAKERGLLVSDKSEKELINKYKLTTVIAGAVVVGLPVIAYFLYSILG